MKFVPQTFHLQIYSCVYKPSTQWPYIGLRARRLGRWGTWIRRVNIVTGVIRIIRHQRVVCSPQRRSFTRSCVHEAFCEKEITNHRRWWRVQPQGNANAKWWNSLIDGEWYGLKAMTPGLQASRSRARALNVHFYLPFHASEPGSSSDSWDSAGKTQGLPVVLYRSSAQWKKRLLWEKEIQNCP